MRDGGRDQDDVFIRRVSDELRAPVRVSEGFDSRVMAAVRGLRGAPARAISRHPLGWLTRPRTVRVSLLAALALAASVAGVALLGAREIASRSGAPSDGLIPAVSPGAVRLVGQPRLQATRFTLAAPGARSVALVGEFNDWDAASTPLERRADGAWEVMVPLAAGRYEYAFVVDGVRTVPDPAAPVTAPSEFGAPNSVVTVGGGTP